MDIPDGQIGILVADDLVKGDVFVDQFQDILYRNACARDTWFAEVNSWINGDTVHLMPSVFLV